MSTIKLSAKEALLLGLLLFISIHSFAQIRQGGSPVHWGDISAISMEWNEFAPLDLDVLRAEDDQTEKFKDAPWRFGIEHAVNWNIKDNGDWSQEEGFAVWRLGVRASQTTNWSFYLSKFKVPKGGELFVWNGDRTAFLGSFTYQNHKKWEGLAIGLLEGESVVVEYRQPLGVQQQPEIEISQVVQGYRSLLVHADELHAKSNSQGPFGNSGACNINVNCPEGADWQVEKKAVALIVNGGFAACTGSLINNTANDGTPYFLTANHCLGNPNTWTYYFNHESATCSGTSGPTSASISGGTLLVADGGADVALIELSSEPLSAWDVEYAGWDASGSTPENATGIHHPSGDLKKICFEEDSPYTSSTGGAQVWWIDAWEAGVTEPGSSGSPLFDQNHRIIGQLYGGAAACSGSVNNGAYDFYGRFGVSWGLGVSDYLDPQNTGTLTLDGYPSGYNSDLGCTDPAACNYDAAALEDDGSCETLDACGVCGGDDSSCSGCTDAEACNYDTEATLDDGSCISGGTQIIFNLLTDNYPAEITWTLEDSAGGTVLSGGPYDSNATTYSAEACLADGCYTLSVLDSYGDGLCCAYGEGNYELADGDGTVYASGASFEFSDVTDFCIESSNETAGCTTSTACNYNPQATVDDGSCTTSDECGVCGGDGIAEGACDCEGNGPETYYTCDGTCTNDTDGDEICDELEIAGCTDDAACDYNPNATDSASCNYAEAGLDCDGNSISCPADLNANGTVEVSDVLLLLSDFGCDSECSVADINGDGSVSVADILLLLAAFGEGC